MKALHETLHHMKQISLAQTGFELSMEKALHDVPLYREFARLDVGMSRMPVDSTIKFAASLAAPYSSARRAPA